MLNKKSKTYKDLGKDLEESNELAVASFLATNPKAMIRPLVVRNNVLIVGFKSILLGDIILGRNNGPEEVLKNQT